MSKISDYQEKLKDIKNWIPFLLQESGLPGKRGNIELGKAVAEMGDEKLFLDLIKYDASKAPVNSQEEFLAFCGVLGLGKLITEGKEEYMTTLRSFASDSRWRTREAVAMALQRIGEVDMNRLLGEMDDWSKGNLMEKRAAAAALCEPALLKDREISNQVLDILDNITKSIKTEENRKKESFRVLKKGLGYCWSVAIVGAPEKGKKLLEKWLNTKDKDILWIMKENLKKMRLQRMDESWVFKLQEMIR